MPLHNQRVWVYRRINLLSFPRDEAGRVFLDTLNASTDTEKFLIQIQVFYFGLNVTDIYSFTVAGGTYRARVCLLYPALLFLPYTMRISVALLSNLKFVFVAVNLIYPDEYPFSNG